MISVVCLVWRRVDTLSLSSMCLRPLSLSLSTRGAPYLVYSVIKGRFLLIHGFNKTRSIGSSAPHSTIIFFQPSKFEHDFQKNRNLDNHPYLDQATSWTRSRTTREVNNHLPRFRAVTRRGQTGRRWFYNQEKSITRKLYFNAAISLRESFLRCVCFFLRTSERERS